MKIVNISGGLGNQMFQYAFALSLKKRYPEEEVFIDTQHYHSLFFKHIGSVNLHNGYELDQLFPKARLPKAGFRQLSRISYYIPNYLLSRVARKVLPVRKTEFVSPYSQNYSYHPEIFTDGDCYYEGYWQCPRYFQNVKEDLLRIYAHPTPNSYNQEMINRISQCESVGIHVRRGDYKNAPEFNGICHTAYYSEAIQQLKTISRPQAFFIFSNDIAWCKSHLQPLIGNANTIYVDGNTGKDSCWDMFLMTYCKNLIIANSSFSWWGAYLNKNARIVIAPDPWLRRDCEINVYEDHWTRVSTTRT